MFDRGFASPSRDTAAFIVPFLRVSDESDKLLNETIRSICTQSDQDWLLILVDDASEKMWDCQEICDAFPILRSKLVYLRSSFRIGPGGCRNIGVQSAYENGCPFVLFLDSDDIALPHRLEKTREAFCNQAFHVVYSPFIPVDAQESEIQKNALSPSIRSIINTNGAKSPIGPDAWIEMATVTGYANLTSTTAVRTNLAKNVPFPNEHVSEDFHTWMRLGASGANFYFIKEPLSLYRILDPKEGSASRQRGMGEFYSEKARVDIQGFESALRIAADRNTLVRDRMPMLRNLFLRRLASELETEQENELAKSIYKRLEAGEKA